MSKNKLAYLIKEDDYRKDMFLTILEENETIRNILIDEVYYSNIKKIRLKYFKNFSSMLNTLKAKYDIEESVINDVTTIDDKMIMTYITTDGDDIFVYMLLLKNLDI